MALIKSEIRCLSPAKKKKRENFAVSAEVSPYGIASSSSSTSSSSESQYAQSSSQAALGQEGQAEKDGLLRVKKNRIQLKTETEELRSVLAPLAAPGATALSGGAGLLGSSITQLLPSTQQQEQAPHTLKQQTLRQHKKGDLKVLENLLIQGRLPVLRSCLLPSPSPSLRTLVLERLAVEAGAFPASFSPFQVLSTSTAMRTPGDDKKELSAGEGGDNPEGKAIVSFLTLLKDALYAAPTVPVSFDAKGRIHDRPTAVLLKHIAQHPAPQHSEHNQQGNSNTNRIAHSGSRSDDSTCCDSSSISNKGVRGVRGSVKGTRKSKKGVLGEDEGNAVEGGRGQMGGEGKEGKTIGEHRTVFTFRAPVAVHVVGSFPLNLTSSFSKNADVCVVMPAHMFGMKDHLNYRYFNKRNAYIQVLYEHLRDLFISLFPSPSTAIASAYTCSPGGYPGREGPRNVTAGAPSGADPSSAAFACTPASEQGALDQDHSSAVDAACSRCAVSAAAFRAVAPHVLPRVFLQAWQGCIEKSVVVIRFLAIQEKPQDTLKEKRVLSSSDSCEPHTSPPQREEERVLQHRLLLQQWNVRVLAVPSTVASTEPKAKQEKQQQSSRASGDSSLTSNPNRKEGDGSKGEKKRRPFAEHLLAVDRNCVRIPTTCCRSLSSAPSLIPSTIASKNVEEENAAEHEHQQDTENLPPTPYYNMLLLEDLRLRQHQRVLYRCCRLYGDAFRQAVLLLKFWGLRRGLLAADNTCFSSSSPVSHPAPTQAGTAVDDDVFCWKETSDVTGFLLAMLCCHACLAAADSLATPVLAQQLLTLTWSFLAEANFLQFVYILGEPQAYRRHNDLKTLRAAFCSGSGSTAVGGIAEAGLAVQRGRKRAASPVAGEITGTRSTAEGKEEVVRDASLSIGLLDEAYLFDSSSCCFNLLWRAQLHVAELQQEARHSLQALQQSADAFHLVFGPPLSSSFAGISNSSNEQSQLYGILHGDVQLYIPQVPQQPHLYLPAAAYPVENYLPFTVRPQRPRDNTAAAAAVTTNAAAAAAGGTSIDVAALDTHPKWETPQHALLGASILRLFVRGLGDRLGCYRVRMRRACCPSATRRTLVTGFGAHPRAAADPETHDAIEGQPLAWTAESAEDFLRKGATTTGLVISLELNAATAARLVERGPSAAVTASAAAPSSAGGVASAAAGVGTSAVAGAGGAATEAIESFKLFWGPTRVEVRRFHDAQTVYAVVWQRPGGEEEQLHALLFSTSGVPGPAAITGSSGAVARPGTVHPRHSAAGRVAAAASSAAAAVQMREQELQIHPPPHTQIIQHLLQRHLSHLLILRQRDDESQQKVQQQHHQQQSSGSTRQQQTVISTKNRKRNINDGRPTSNVAETNAGVCYLESTPLGAIPGLSQRHKQLTQTFNELRNTICALSSLPLAIKQIWHAGAALRFADALPLPDSDGFSTAFSVDEPDRGLHRVVVEFEDSAAWPDDMDAVRHVKVAFLLAMRKELLSDHGIYGVVSPCASLDVELGLFTFRIIIFHPAEAAGAAALYAEPRWEPLYSYLRERSRHTELVSTTSSNSSSNTTSRESGSLPISVGRKNKRKKGYRQQLEATEEEVAQAEEQKQVQQHLYSLFSSMDAEEEDSVLARPFANPLFARKCLDAEHQQEEERRINCLRCMWWEPQVAAVLQACALRYPPFAGMLACYMIGTAEPQTRAAVPY